MSKESLIRRAEFNPRVRSYWLWSGALPFVLSIVGIPLLLIWFPLGYVLTGRYLSHMECELTAKALKVKKGMFVRVEKTIPLEKITDMALVQGPIMRAMDIERLTVETAGQSGAGALVSLTGIAGAKDFREAVLAQRDQMAEGAPHREPATAAPADDDHLRAIRDSLRRIESLLGEALRRDS